MEGEDKPSTPLPKIDPYLLKVDKLDKLEEHLEEPIPYEDLPEDEEEEEEEEDLGDGAKNEADDGFAAGEPEVAKKKTPEPTEETDQAAAERVNEQAADKEGLDEV